VLFFSLCSRSPAARPLLSAPPMPAAACTPMPQAQQATPPPSPSAAIERANVRAPTCHGLRPGALGSSGPPHSAAAGVDSRGGCTPGAPLQGARLPPLPLRDGAHGLGAIVAGVPRQVAPPSRSRRVPPAHDPSPPATTTTSRASTSATAAAGGT